MPCEAGCAVADKSATARHPRQLPVKPRKFFIRWLGAGLDQGHYLKVKSELFFPGSGSGRQVQVHDAEIREMVFEIGNEPSQIAEISRSANGEGGLFVGKFSQELLRFARRADLWDLYTLVRQLEYLDFPH